MVSLGTKRLRTPTPSPPVSPHGDRGPKRENSKSHEKQKISDVKPKPNLSRQDHTQSRKQIKKPIK